MRIYSASDEETLRDGNLLKDWAGEGLISKEQYQTLKQQTISDLRTANIFLRMVLLFFTLVIVGAAAGLFFAITSPSEQAIGAFLMVFAAVCYIAAEIAVTQFRLHRYGIEEALLMCSVGFLCGGIEAAFFTEHYSPRDTAHALVPAVGAAFSLWIWRRFGLWYAFPAAMIFSCFVPGYWTRHDSDQHVMIALIFAIGLMCIAAARHGNRDESIDADYSLAEALLWLGIYLALNLKLSSLVLPAQRWIGWYQPPEFAKAFYWTTWVLIWCLPPVILARGIREKDRFVLAAGAIAALLTLATNKPYLGWPRHTWDPMILGILLTAVALFLRRWLDRGPNGIRHGFTAERLSAKDKQWISTGSAVLGLVTPQAVTPSPQTTPDFHFGGGSSGGGGASSEF